MFQKLMSLFNWKPDVKISLTTLFKLFQENNIDEIIRLLQLQNNNGCNAAMLLARSESSKTVKQYIGLLARLNRSGVPVGTLLDILKLQDNEGWTFGMDLAHCHDGSTISTYLELLQLLVAENAVTPGMLSLMKIKAKIQQVPIQYWTFTDIVINCQDIQVIYRLLNSGLVPDEEYIKFSYKHSAIVHYMLSVSDHFLKKNMLKDALDVTHPVGKLFKLDDKVRNFPVRDCKNLIREELINLEERDKNRWCRNFFPQEPTHSINAYIELQDPFCMRDTKYKK